MKKLGIVLCLGIVAAVSIAGISRPADAKAVVATVQGGEVFTHKEAGVQFQLPTGWKAKPDGEVITVSSADDALQVVFWVPDEDTFDAAVKAIDDELGKTIKKMKTNGKPIEDTHNGMPHFEVSGSGEVDGSPIEWSADLLGAKKPLIILTFAAPTLFEKHADAYLKLVGSIKKVQ